MKKYVSIIVFGFFAFALPVDAESPISVSHQSKNADYVQVGETVKIIAQTTDKKPVPVIMIQVNAKQVQNCYNVAVCQANYIVRATDDDLSYYASTHTFNYASTANPFSQTGFAKGPEKRVFALSGEKVAPKGINPVIYMNPNKEKVGKFEPLTVNVVAMSDVGIDHIYFDGPISGEKVCRSSDCVFTVRPGSHQYASLDIQPHILRAMVVDKAGRYNWTEVKQVAIDGTNANTYGDNVYPAIDVAHDTTYADGSTATFAVTAKDDKGISSLKVYDLVTGSILKDCGAATTCTVSKQASIAIGVVGIHVVALDASGNEMVLDYPAFVIPSDVLAKQKENQAEQTKKFNENIKTIEQKSKPADSAKKAEPKKEEPKKETSKKVDIMDRDVIKSDKHASVYYIDNGVRRPFVNQAVFKTWYRDFSGVKHVSVSQVEDIPLGKPVSVRPGHSLIKFPLNPKVYEVLADSVATHLPSEAVAKNKYGESWGKRIIELPEIYSLFYTFQ